MGSKYMPIMHDPNTHVWILRETWEKDRDELRYLRACSHVKEAAARVTGAEHRAEMYERHAKEAEEWGAFMEAERDAALAEAQRLRTLLASTQEAFCHNCPTLHGEQEELDAIVELREAIWDLVTDGFQRSSMIGDPSLVVACAIDVIGKLKHTFVLWNEGER